jgi:hypothetical protein
MPSYTPDRRNEPARTDPNDRSKPMTTPLHGAQRPIALQAVRTLIADARAQRAALPLQSAERTFYLGVEAAAEEVLRPELASARAEGWLEREAAPFREGYLQTSNMLAVALTATDIPPRLRLPAAS